MKTLYTYIFLSLGCFISLFAQPIPKKGVPLLEKFTPAVYDHSGKVWGIDTAPNGIVYMASDKGLLEYDGESWVHYAGSEGITRSINVVSDSVIYTGSDLDFGIWKRNRFNEFEYTSLYPFKEDLTGISEEFWNIHHTDSRQLFISESNIYVYSDQNLTKIPVPGRIVESFKIGGEVYLIDEQEGIYRLENLSPTKIFDIRPDNNIEIVGMYEHNGELSLVSQNSGLFSLRNGQLTPVNGEVSEKLKSANVFSFTHIDSSYLAFGTILNGLYITDMQGNLLHHINKSKGLQNNTILSMHSSPNNKLWLGLDYGVSSLNLSDRYSLVLDNRGNFGTAYAAILKDDMFYLGTNQGLYTTDWENLNNSNEFYNFELIEGTEGQVWGLDEFDGQIWISHDQGLFVWEDDQLERISGRTGFLTILPYKNYLLAGTYNGISIFEKTADDNWQFLKQMDLIAGSVDQIVLDDYNELWINIPNFGVIKTDLNENLNPQDREIFESAVFQDSDHRLEKSETDIAVITRENRFVFQRAEGDLTAFPRENINNDIQDFLLWNGRSTLINDQFEFYPVYNGFALKDLSIEQKNPDSNVALIIRNVMAFNNDESKQTYPGAEISYRINNLRIKAIVPNLDQVAYQFWSDQSGEWTEPGASNTFELIGLEYGEHTVKAKAIINGESSNTVSFNFEILPPWYRSWYAYIIYLGLFLVALYSFYVWFGISLDKQKKNLLKNQRESLKKQQDRFQQQLKRVEQEKLKAEYKNLKAELKNKTIELATKAKENDEKNKVLQNLKEKFEKIEENPASLKRNIGEIKRVIDQNLSTEEDSTFEIQIDELHQDFFDALRKDFPDLTRYDLRLCAYIKIGFDSKEIADLLNIKPSSVYISRSRLRKKLDIETDEDLHSYLNSV